MTSDQEVLNLLSEIESALEDHSYALSGARKLGLSTEERLAIIKAGKNSWERLVAAQLALEDAAG